MSTRPPWKVLVQVIEKRKAKESQNNNLPYRNYVLTDMKGTRIGVGTFGTNVAAVGKILFPFRRYYVFNAGVRPVDERYRIGEYNYTWTLTHRTPMQPVKIPMLMRLWTDWLDNDAVQVSAKYPEPTLIVGLNMKATTHNGLSVTTGWNGYIMVKPPLSENPYLLQWYTENENAITQLVHSKAYKNVDFLIPPPLDAAQIVGVGDVISSIEVLKTAWVSVRTELMPAHESLWYSVCSGCNKSIIAVVGELLYCNSCGEEKEVVPRCHMEVFLTDDTGTLGATLFSPDAERMTTFTAVQVKAAEDEGAPLTQKIEALLYRKQVFCFVKYFDTEFRGNAVRKYPILKLYTQEEVIKARQIAAGEFTEVGALNEPGAVPHLAGSSVGATSTDNQLFSPTAKEILQEIEAESAQSAVLDVQLPATKRTLLFDDNSAKEICDNLASVPMPPAQEGVAAIPIGESPVKKSKNKGKDKDF